MDPNPNVNYSNWDEALLNIQRSHTKAVDVFRRQVYPTPRRVVQKGDVVRVPDGRQGMVKSINPDGTIGINYGPLTTSMPEAYTGKLSELQLIESFIDAKASIADNVYYAVLGSVKATRNKQAVLAAPPVYNIGTPVMAKGYAGIVVGESEDKSTIRVKFGDGNVGNIPNEYVAKIKYSNYKVATLDKFTLDGRTVPKEIAGVHVTIREAGPKGLISYTVDEMSDTKMYVGNAEHLKFPDALYHLGSIQELLDHSTVKKEASNKVTIPIVETNVFKINDPVMFTANNGKSISGEVIRIEGTVLTVAVGSKGVEDHRDYVDVDTAIYPTLHLQEDRSKLLANLVADGRKDLARILYKDASIHSTSNPYNREYFLGKANGHIRLSKLFKTYDAAKNFLADELAVPDVYGDGDTGSGEVPSILPSIGEFELEETVNVSNPPSDVYNDVAGSDNQATIKAVDEANNTVTLEVTPAFGGSPISFTGDPTEMGLGKIANSSILPKDRVGYHLDLLIERGLGDTLASVFRDATIEKKAGKYYVMSANKAISTGYFTEQEAIDRKNVLSPEVTPEVKTASREEILNKFDMENVKAFYSTESNGDTNINIVTKGIPIGSILAVPSIGGDNILVEVKEHQSMSYVGGVTPEAGEAYWLRVLDPLDDFHIQNALKKLAKDTGLVWGNSEDSTIKFVSRNSLDAALQHGEVAVAQLPNQDDISDPQNPQGAPSSGTAPGQGGISPIRPSSTPGGISSPVLSTKVAHNTVISMFGDDTDPWGVMEYKSKSGETKMVIYKKYDKNIEM